MSPTRGGCDWRGVWLEEGVAGRGCDWRGMTGGGWGRKMRLVGGAGEGCDW